MTCDQTLQSVIPAATIQAAQRAFPTGNRSMTMRDALGPIFTNPDFADRSRNRGRPAESPAHLALILVLQHLDPMSAAAAAAAVRARIDWNYALARELDDPGVAASILPDVRRWLLPHGTEARVLTLVRDTLVDAGVLKARGRQRSDSTHIVCCDNPIPRGVLRHDQGGATRRRWRIAREHRAPATRLRQSVLHQVKDEGIRVNIGAVGEDNNSELVTRKAPISGLEALPTPTVSRGRDVLVCIDFPAKPVGCPAPIIQLHGRECLGQGLRCEQRMRVQRPVKAREILHGGVDRAGADQMVQRVPIIHRKCLPRDRVPPSPPRIIQPFGIGQGKAAGHP